MVRRTDPFEGKEIQQSRLKLFNNTQAVILIRLLPKFGEDFPRYNSRYLAKMLNINFDYLEELLEFFINSDIVSFDGEDYYLTDDNVWRIQEILSRQSMIILARNINKYSE